MIQNDIVARLFSMQDTAYQAFQAKLLPTVQAKAIIGVRTPALKAYAKELVKTHATTEFLAAVPHQYFEENQLHAFIIAAEKDFSVCIAAVECFLPYIDNWATCDQLLPAVFKKQKTALVPYILRWLTSTATYTVRFAIGMCMRHFLDEAFDPQFPHLIAAIRSDEYYVNMMIAWYFATALAKQYTAVLPYLTEKRLAPWVHNKTIQKAVESFCITSEQKAYLASLRIAIHRERKS